MPKKSELDELESLLVFAGDNICGELGASVREALDVIRASRAEIGPECTVHDLIRFLESVDDGARSKRSGKAHRTEKRILH